MTGVLLRAEVGRFALIADEPGSAQVIHGGRFVASVGYRMQTLRALRCPRPKALGAVRQGASGRGNLDSRPQGNRERARGSVPRLRREAKTPTGGREEFSEGSDPLGGDHRPGAAGVAGVEGGGGLEEEDVDLLFGDGAVLDAAGDDDELAFAEGEGPVAELHREGAAEDEEELVLVLVAVPDEGAEELDDLDVLAVQLGDDLRVPVRGEAREPLREVNDVHVGLRPCGAPAASAGGRG